VTRGKAAGLTKEPAFPLSLKTQRQSPIRNHLSIPQQRLRIKAPLNPESSPKDHEASRFTLPSWPRKSGKLGVDESTTRRLEIP